MTKPLSPADREIEDLALALATADRSGTQIASADVGVPASRSHAMAVQAATLRHLSGVALGWKIAIGPNQAPVAAPIVDLLDGRGGSAILHGCGRCHAVEIELGLVLKAGLPARPDRPYTRDEVREAIASVHLGIEILRHRLREEGQAPFALFLADRLGNGGYVLGPVIGPDAWNVLATADWTSGLPPIRIRRDDAPLYEGSAIHPNGDPLSPLLAYANAAYGERDELTAGQFVTTGSLCGVVPIRKGGCLQIDWLVTLEFSLET